MFTILVHFFCTFGSHLRQNRRTIRMLAHFFCTKPEHEVGVCMLLEFSVANFRSFKSPQRLNMVAGRDQGHADSIVKQDGFGVLKAAGIFGPNASGKSNLLEAINALRVLVVDSASKWNVDDRIPLESFKLDPKYVNRPSAFSARVLIEGREFSYKISATRKEIHSEQLLVGAPGDTHQEVWFRRRKQIKEESYTWTWGGPLEKDGEVLESRTRSNACVVSTGAQLNVQSLTAFYKWWNSLWHFDLSSPTNLAAKTARWMNRDERRRQRVALLLRHADLGIDDVHDTESTMTLKDMVEEIGPKSLVSLISDLASDSSVSRMNVVTKHTACCPEYSVAFDLDEESNGTQRLFSILGPILDAMDRATVVLIDEIDCSLHTHLTQAIVRMFQNPNINPRGAQLIFTSHDSNLMDQRLVRRDQVWLTQKKPNGGTDMFTLYDFEGRSTERFPKNYLQGRYQAVPLFGPAFEDDSASWIHELQDAGDMSAAGQPG